MIVYLEGGIKFVPFSQAAIQCKELSCIARSVLHQVCSSCEVDKPTKEINSFSRLRVHWVIDSSG